eukprot:Opistho-2@4982
MWRPRKRLMASWRHPSAKLFVITDCRIVSILKSSHLGPLSSASEVRLERACARIVHADGVGIVGPHVLEAEFKVSLAIKHVAGAGDLETDELLGERLVCDHALYDVCAVQTVDAVRAECPRLARQNGTIAVKLEIPLLIEIRRNLVHKQRQFVPAHLAAFVVEVKCNVPRLLVVDCLECVGKRLPQRQLRALLVNEVDENGGSVVCDDLAEVGATRGHVIRLRVYAHRRLVLDVGKLCPEQRNRTSDLHIRCVHAVVMHNLLRLGKVGDVAKLVNAAGVKARALPEATAARDDNEVKRLVLDRTWIDGHEAMHDGEDEVLELGNGGKVILQMPVPVETVVGPI